jgi:DNA excision repair protein ERCC-3
MTSPNGPLILQSDRTLMLEVAHPEHSECRDFLTTFAELVKSPEFIHTYRVTPLSLWNAAALDIPLADIVSGLERFSRYHPPENVLTDIREWYAAYGQLILEKDSGADLMRLRVNNGAILNRIRQDPELAHFWAGTRPDGFLIRAGERGNLKQALIKLGYPVKDIGGYVKGTRLEISLADADPDGRKFALYDYQKDAVEAFYQSGCTTGGSGIVVLACGSGKTLIGLGVISQCAAETLIITTNNVSVHQWQHELLSRTTLSADAVGEFTGIDKQIRPVTITTYQMLTHRRSREVPMENLALFTKNNWGLIIYDEVHMLPAPVFRATAEIQARRRLGLTATLVREDGKEDEVFALIGPKRFDVPWKVLENRGFIAQALCTEYRISLPDREELSYAHAPKRQRFRIASENTAKLLLVMELLEHHRDDKILIIGQFVSQLEGMSKALDLPLITGKTAHADRETRYAEFKTGRIRTLIVSKVANFAVDLPDASVMIQVSGTFGSRQEEAQRLGRILRPKEHMSHFYTLVSSATEEQEFAVNRQLFLVEQGYKYTIRYFNRREMA